MKKLIIVKHIKNDSKGVWPSVVHMVFAHHGHHVALRSYICSPLAHAIVVAVSPIYMYI